MKMKSRTTILIVSTVLVILVAAGFILPKVPVWMKRKSLDNEYEESFPHPTEISSALKGKKVVYHIRTGLGVDDAQIC